MNIKKLFFLVIALSFSVSFFSQDIGEIDSLKKIIKTTIVDSTKVNALKKWNSYIYLSDLKLDYEIIKQIEEICLKNLNSDKNFNNKFQTELAFCYNSLGNNFETIGNYSQALSYYYKSLETYNSLSDSSGISKSYINIGDIYVHQSKYSKALDYFEKSRKINLSIGNDKDLSKTLNNVAGVYVRLEKYNVAIDYYNKSLKIRTKINDSISLSSSYTNIGICHEKLKDSTLALEYYLKGLNLNKYFNKVEQEINSKYLIGKLFKNQGDTEKAIKFLLNSLNGASEIKANNYINVISKELYEIYSKMNVPKEAIKFLEIYSNSKDSLSVNNADILIQKNELREEQLSDSLIFANEILIQKSIAKNEKTKNTLLIVVIFIILIFSVFLFKIFKKTKKQKKIISFQHQELDKSHIELTNIYSEMKDSINYAKKIQEALLTPKHYIEDALPNNFIYYLPKDVVSGDFYWVHKVSENKIFFTVSDCTGHGVPGAFMSMIGKTLLNENIIDNKIYDTSKVLDNMKSKISSLLNQKGVDIESMDGMHMALCCLDLKNSILEYSGSFNPLIHVRNGELVQIKADPQPIGYYSGEKVKSFNKHQIKLQKGDCLYIYTDGFQDQFGGPKNKKYMSKRFKNLLSSISEKPMEKQYLDLKSEFKNWIGENEQIDDLCIMGIKI